MCHAHLVLQPSKEAGKTVIFNKRFGQNTISFYYELVIITLVKMNTVYETVASWVFQNIDTQKKFKYTGLSSRISNRFCLFCMRNHHKYYTTVTHKETYN